MEQNKQTWPDKKNPCAIIRFHLPVFLCWHLSLSTFPFLFLIERRVEGMGGGPFKTLVLLGLATQCVSTIPLLDKTLFFSSSLSSPSDSHYLCLCCSISFFSSLVLSLCLVYSLALCCPVSPPPPPPPPHSSPLLFTVRRITGVESRFFWYLPFPPPPPTDLIRSVGINYSINHVGCFLVAPENCWVSERANAWVCVQGWTLIKASFSSLLHFFKN